MQADVLERRLTKRGAYYFQGDPRSNIFQVVFRSQRPGPGSYMVLIDSRWDAPTVERYYPEPLELEDRVKAAQASGVQGFICDSETAKHPVLAGANVFHAEDAADLAFRIAEIMRDSRGGRRVTAITGSAGKSTTKAMLAHALQATSDVQRIYSPPSTQNIYTSVISHMTRVNRYGHSVLEVAGSAFSPFLKHDFAVSADVSIVTSISEAHLDYLGSLEGIAKRKSHIFDRPAPGGTAIINLDTPHSDLLVRRAVEEGCQVVTYGESNEATVQLVSYDVESGTVVASFGQEVIEYRVGARGHHMALNSLAVLAALRSYRTSSWRKGIRSLSRFKALKGRGKTSNVDLSSEVSITVVDEAYNANPASIEAALRGLADRETHNGGRRVAVLGDMLELGKDPGTLHRGLADAVRKYSPDVLHLYGEHMAGLYAEVRDKLEHTVYWDSLDQLSDHVRGDAHDGDVLLVKSSNGTGLHEVVAALV